MVEVKAKNNTGRNKISSFSGDVYFVPVVDGKEYSHAAETEDMAMLIGFGLKYDGPNTQFPKMAARMLGIESVWSK